MKDFIAFTKQERRGIVTFLALSLSVMIGVRWYTYQFPVEQHMDVSHYYLPVDSMEVLDDIDDGFYPDFNTSRKGSKKSQPKEKFAFDPNTLAEDSLLRLGFSSFSVRNLINFRSKGGKIKDLEKLKSIYGIDTNLVNELKDLARFESVKPPSYPVFKKDSISKNYADKPNIPQDINSMDSLELIAIRGIGPYLAYKILDYRRKLGGYIRKEQLLEISKINDSIYLNLEKYFLVDVSKVTPININTAEYKDFVTHPYFTKDIATKILKYRKQHGPFEKAHHISRIRNLKQEEGEKILPYLAPR